MMISVVMAHACRREAWPLLWALCAPPSTLKHMKPENITMLAWRIGMRHAAINQSRTDSAWETCHTAMH